MRKKKKVSQIRKVILCNYCILFILALVGILNDVVVTLSVAAEAKLIEIKYLAPRDNR